MKQTKNNMLNGEQSEIVKHFIVMSMRDVYTDNGSLPSDGFDIASSQIADKIIKNVQMALIQNSVFQTAVANSKPLNKGKITKVTKKNVRK